MGSSHLTVQHENHLGSLWILRDCLDSRQTQTQNKNNPSGIISQQGGVQNCQGTRCNQNNPAGSSVIQSCRGSQCNQNNGRVPPSTGGQANPRIVQQCNGSHCTRTDSFKFAKKKSSNGNRNVGPFGDCFPFCDQ